MLIFPDSDLIVFAIPKTGSTAFEQTFGKEIANSVVVPENLKHMNVRQFETKRSDPRNSLFENRMERMAILRDPLARLDSWYRYRRRLDRANPKSTGAISFEDFIGSTMLTSPPAFAQNVGDQWHFCTRKNGTLGINHIFDIAYPGPLDDFLQARLGRRFPRGRVNVSEAKNSVLSTDVESRLRDHRRQEFAFYDSVVKNGGYLCADLQD